MMRRKKISPYNWVYGKYPLAVIRMTPQNPTLFHYHDFMELVIIKSGQGIHFTGTGSYPIAAGDAFVIREHDAHGYSSANNLQLVNVLYYPDKLALPLKELDNLRGYHALFETRRPAHTSYGLKNHLRLDLKQLTYIEGLISSLEQELKDKKIGFSFTAKALLMLTISFLSRYYEDRQIREQSSLVRISNAIAYIEENYTKSIRPADMASSVHMSPRNLYRCFKSVTGFSPIEYLIRLRIMHGAELLRRGELNVTETAFQTGFNDSNYFSRKFHEVMGLCPRQFVLYPNIRIDKPREYKTFTVSRQPVVNLSKLLT